jgi:hypothetical protein
VFQVEAIGGASMVYFSFLFIGAVAIFIIAGAFQLLAVYYRNWEETQHNDAQPLDMHPARVVAKRLNASGHDHVSTWYYLTFEFQTGERREYCVSGEEYGLIAEGDQGLLTSQGTRYHQFLREPPRKGR